MKQILNSDQLSWFNGIESAFNLYISSEFSDSVSDSLTCFLQEGSYFVVELFPDSTFRVIHAADVENYESPGVIFPIYQSSSSIFFSDNLDDSLLRSVKDFVLQNYKEWVAAFFSSVMFNFSFLVNEAN